MTKLKLQTDAGIIEGTESFNHTGNEKNLVMIEFRYNERNYKMPFSRKTGKLYGMKLPFNIHVIK